jgi:hypothetical protein
VFLHMLYISDRGNLLRILDFSMVLYIQLIQVSLLLFYSLLICWSGNHSALSSFSTLKTEIYIYDFMIRFIMRKSSEEICIFTMEYDK